MSKRTAWILAVLAVSVLPVRGAAPQTWDFRSRADFLRGKFDGVSLSWDGVLGLAPRVEKGTGPAEEFYLSCVGGSDGALFLGTGHGGKVYRIAKDGTTEVYYQTAEMDVTALAVDDKGVLFAATSPNGKIYKVADKGKGEPFFNPMERYIWALAFDRQGTLLAAVGESGGIYAVNSLGEGQLVLKTAENHVLCLAFDAQGAVYAGSGGRGSVYRLAGGKSSLLFESPYEEVRALVPAEDGSVFASAGGTSPAAKKDDAAAGAARVGTDVAVVVLASAPESGPSGSPREAAAIYRIAPEGPARRLWASDEDVVYTMIREPGADRILFGTGPKGRLYALDAGERATLLTQEGAEQVFALAASDGGVRILSNNPPGLAVLYPDQRPAGEYLSPVLDARTTAAWGRLVWEGAVPQGALVQFQTRSGNTAEPNPTWSDWSPPYQKAEEPVLSPRARCLQFRIQIKSPSGRAVPTVARARLFYAPSNLKPEIVSLDWLGPNEVYLEPPTQDEVIWGLDAGADHRPAKPEEDKSVLTAKKVLRKGYQTAVWEARDENDDVLSFSLRLKRDGETAWRLLADAWVESLYAFDTTVFPDGTYVLKLEASDAPSNPAGSELRAERVSLPLVIDNSLPVVKGFTAVRDKAKGGLAISFQAEDAFSAIAEVEIMVRPQGWRVVVPADGICDSKQETFSFILPLPPVADDMVVVRVKDAHGNVGVVRQTY
jgi:hypothetical protein